MSVSALKIVIYVEFASPEKVVDQELDNEDGNKAKESVLVSTLVS